MDVSPSALRGAASSSARAERDRELRDSVAAIARGDQAAMARFYDGTNAIAFALIVRLVPDRDQAEEVLLDVYMQIWRRAASFDPSRGEVATWLLTIARSRALDRRRARAAHERRHEAWSEELDASLADCSCGCDPLEVRATAERCRGVREAIALLPAEQRRVVELAFLGELTHAQIAERTALPLGTVKTRIRLGMIRLREQLASWETHL
jgi:RNA polymerase sigma-70 factor (ECF subfamily)